MQNFEFTYQDDASRQIKELIKSSGVTFRCDFNLILTSHRNPNNIWKKYLEFEIFLEKLLSRKLENLHLEL